MLSPIKIVLILPLIGFILLLLVRLRSTTFSRILLITVAAMGVVLVLFPDLTTAIAKRLNVGRGTDLILYLSAISGFIALTGFYSRVRRIEQTQTDIIRQLAIQNRKKINNDDES